MKWLNSIIILFFVFLFSGFYAFSQFTPKEMFAEAALERWGHDEFDAKKFKAGDFSLRAKMAYEVLQNQPYAGKSVQVLRRELGGNEGYYKNDVVPAYILNQDLNDIWQIVFLVDTNRNVTKAVIYKNCCER
jgi:hypothetical protein